MPCQVVMRPVGILLIVEVYEKLNLKSLCVEFLVIITALKLSGK